LRNDFQQEHPFDDSLSFQTTFTSFAGSQAKSSAPSKNAK
jgi:hypothetical protein